MRRKKCNKDFFFLFLNSQSAAKNAESFNEDGETAILSMQSVQNSPIVHFTPSSLTKQTLPAPPPSLSGATSLFYSHVHNKADTLKSESSVEEAASLASIRAARNRIKSASQQEP